MKIGIDLRSLQESSAIRGIGSYATNLMWEISKIDKDNEYYIFAYSTQADYIQKKIPHSANINFLFLGKPKLRGKFIIRTLFLSNEKLKKKYTTQLDSVLLLDPLYEIKEFSKGVPVVMDLIPIIYPQKYLEVKIERRNPQGLFIYIKRLALRRKFINTFLGVNKYKKIITISNASANDINKIANVPYKKISAIHLGTIKLKKQENAKPTREISEKYFLYVGGTDWRKNLIKFIADIRKMLTKNDLRFVIAGSEMTNRLVVESNKISKFIKKNNLEKYVITPGYVSDGELSYLYENAEAFVFPSRYEGFGLPVLEAMQSGCPVVAYDNSSIPEVAGNAAILVKDGESMVPALEDLMQDKGKRKALIEKGYKQAEKFSWKRTAQETIKVLEGVGDENRH